MAVKMGEWLAAEMVVVMERALVALSGVETADLRAKTLVGMMELS
jgi:hypothetical protein